MSPPSLPISVRGQRKEFFPPTRQRKKKKSPAWENKRGSPCRKTLGYIVGNINDPFWVGEEFLLLLFNFFLLLPFYPYVIDISTQGRPAHGALATSGDLNWSLTMQIQPGTESFDSIALPTRSGGIAVAKCMKKRTGRRWVEGMGDPIERERERERELRLMIFRLDPPLGSPSLFRFSRLSWCARPIFFFSLFLYNAAQIDSW